MFDNNMVKTIKVGDIVAEPGTKAFGYLKVDETNGITTSLPIGIVNGAKDGPTISLTGCTQGSTYTGPEAAIRIWRETDPKELCGAIITVPVVNVPLFNAKAMRQNPIDGKIIERQAFPGNPDGTSSFVIAHKLFTEVILQSQYHIDFRGGDLDESETHFILYSVTGNKEVDDEQHAIAKICGQKLIFRTKWREARKSGLSGAALDRGVVSVIAMLCRGMGEYLESDIIANIEFATNVMKYLKMIPGEVTPVEDQLVFDQSGRITATHGGIWHPTIGWANLLEKGQVTGYVKDLKGDVLQEVVSPIDGVVHVLKPARMIHKGETLYSYQTLKKAWD